MLFQNDQSTSSLKTLFLYYIGPIANLYNFCITDVKKGLAGVGLISYDERIGVPLLEKGKMAGTVYALVSVNVAKGLTFEVSFS